MSKIVPELTKSGNEGHVKKGDDFIEPVKQTLADYLRKQQTDPETGNKHLDNSTFATEEDIQKHEQGEFYRNLPAHEFSKIQEIVQTTLDTDITALDILSAIEGVPGDVNGIIVGSDGALATESDPTAQTIVRATSAVLQTNRFSPGTPFFQNGKIPDTFAVMPKEFGTSAPGAPAQFDELRKVGLSLMLRATGEFIEGDPTSPGVSLASLLPGQAQLGVRIDGNTLRAESVPGAPGVGLGAKGRRSKLRDVLGSGQASFGQLNSCNEPFAGFIPIGMTGLAAILIIALQLATRALLGIFSIIGASKPGRKAHKQATNQLTMGEYRRERNQKSALIKLSDIGIIHLDRDYTEAAQAGVKVFFGFKNNGKWKNVTRSAGFYANMVRVIIQSGARIITDIVDAFRVISGGNIVSGAQAVLGIVDVLKTSKIIAFLNIIAQIGDRALAAEARGIQKLNGDDIAPRGSLVDALVTTPQTRQGKSRDQAAQGALAWRQSAAPSALILPKSMHIAGGNISTLKGVHVLASAHDKMRGPDLNFNTGKVDDSLSLDAIFDTPRISREVAEQIEATLEAEYVPFYFHDLRTNEFLSFHAFIANVNESFAPNYNSSTPYGRVDPVMTYTNTTRTFNLSFHVVATSEEDFDMMYVKLNKLVTLVYPQWTKGRLVTDADGRQFRQPFSQIPGASPLVRLRLGDLFKSNYSNLALARLFGVGEESFLSEAPETQVQAVAKMRQGIEKRIAEYGWPIGAFADMAPIEPKHLTKQEIAHLKSDKATEHAQARFKAGVANKSKLTVKIKSEEGWDEFRDKIQRLYLVALVDNNGIEIGDGATMLVPENLLILSHETVAKAVEQSNENPSEATQAQPPTVNSKTEFFDFSGGKTNAVVRSFKNTQGKGTAGFITSLNMDWNEANQNGKWDTGTYGSRAPQLCKIDISFTVIHDIPPGLDADGFNRAPVYPTGQIMNRLAGDVYDSTGIGETEMAKVQSACEFDTL